MYLIPEIGPTTRDGPLAPLHTDGPFCSPFPEFSTLRGFNAAGYLSIIKWIFYPNKVDSIASFG